MVAFLTILGFSLYDTVVVFDKVRENQARLGTERGDTYSAMVNRSLNQVLMRSLNTSLVAVLPVASLLFVGTYVFGGLVLRDFALALFVGLLTGAYSSIFVATPLLAWLKEREPRYRALRARAVADLERRRERADDAVPVAAAPSATSAVVADGGAVAVEDVPADVPEDVPADVRRGRAAARGVDDARARGRADFSTLHERERLPGRCRPAPAPATWKETSVEMGRWPVSGRGANAAVQVPCAAVSEPGIRRQETAVVPPHRYDDRRDEHHRTARRDPNRPALGPALAAPPHGRRRGRTARHRVLRTSSPYRHRADRAGVRPGPRRRTPSRYAGRASPTSPIRSGSR